MSRRSKSNLSKRRSRPQPRLRSLESLPVLTDLLDSMSDEDWRTQADAAKKRLRKTRSPYYTYDDLTVATGLPLEAIPIRIGESDSMAGVLLLKRKSLESAIQVADPDRYVSYERWRELTPPSEQLSRRCNNILDELGDKLGPVGGKHSGVTTIPINHVACRIAPLPHSTGGSKRTFEALMDTQSQA
jgi:hypothetical protein